MFIADDHMRTVRVRAQSPDGSVTATMTAEAGVSVQIASGSLQRYDVDRLAESVRAAVKGAMDGYRKASEKILCRERGEDALANLWNDETGRKLRPFFEALERVNVSATGERDVVKVGLVDGEFRVKFADRALHLLESVLAAEVDATIKTAFARRSDEADRLYTELVEQER